MSDVTDFPPYWVILDTHLEFYFRFSRYGDGGAEESGDPSLDLADFVQNKSRRGIAHSGAAQHVPNIVSGENLKSLRQR